MIVRELLNAAGQELADLLSAAGQELANLLSAAGQELADLLYPRRCPFCHEIIPDFDALICPDCRQFVRTHYLIREPVCKRCGKALTSMETEYCQDCMSHRRSFDGGISLFLYGTRHLPPVAGRKPGYENNSMGKSMVYFKYHNARDYADYYIAELLHYHKDQIRAMHADVIIPVPVHKSRLRLRGYNQAGILADKLSRKTGIPVDKGLLIRTRKTAPMKELGDADRLRNLTAAFSVTGPAPEHYYTAILIDDIYTTGATMEACTRKLKEAGIRKVYCISICSGQVPDGTKPDMNQD